MIPEQLLAEAIGFDWDDGNTGKNWPTHSVTEQEVEQLFQNLPILIAPDRRHSETEARLVALGRTHADRLLFVAFVIRDQLIRPISSRDMSRREVTRYANAR